MSNITGQPGAPAGNAAVDRTGLPLLSLVPFLLITFLVAWGILALYIFLPDHMAGLFGHLTGRHPLFFLAVWAPAIAALVIVQYHTGGSGLARFLARFLIWRCPPWWYAFLIVGIPLVFIAGAALRGTLPTAQFPFATLSALIVGLNRKTMFTRKQAVTEVFPRSAH